MIHILKGGTDAAGMLLFDPQALPEDFDERTRGEAAQTLEEAAREGRLFRLEPGGNGSYSLGLCVGEEPPEDVADFLRLVDEADRLIVRNRLFFAGIEYGFRDDGSFLAKHPHMGEYADVPPGTYRLRLFVADYPEGIVEDRLRGRVAGAAVWLDGIMRRFLLPIGSLGAIAGMIGLALMGWREWRVTALPVSLAMVLPAFVVSLLPAYREAREARRDVEDGLPDYWAVLERVSDA
ncbi:hypothetical protein [Paludisphaera rhizosphaerae]|uniref:hypothetical protein n=1 Tax=Paludisphaera rhizosphaerae TaxID=2711216 RepID=UPI0013EA52BC|nr:hypothetical protein [Paludisphaera rhizosphaerae]